VYRLSLSDFADTIRPSSTHDINFATAFEMAKKWGYDIPKDIRIYGIEVVELSKFAEGCTPRVAEKLGEIVEYIFNDLAAENQSN
jgi:hypothetical protein